MFFNIKIFPISLSRSFIALCQYFLQFWFKNKIQNFYYSKSLTLETSNYFKSAKIICLILKTLPNHMQLFERKNLKFISSTFCEICAILSLKYMECDILLSISRKKLILIFIRINFFSNLRNYFVGLLKIYAFFFCKRVIEKRLLEISRGLFS